MIAIITGIILYLLTGLASAHFYDQVEGGALMPGLLFTSATIIVFVLTGISFRIRNLLWYYTAMYAAYVCAFYLTFLTAWFAFMTGILTGGLGALATFWLTNRYIKKISFNVMRVFISGALAFIINDVLLIAPVADLIRPIYVIDSDLNTMFAGTFLFWQAIVGINLLLALQRKDG